MIAVYGETEADATGGLLRQGLPGQLRLPVCGVRCPGNHVSSAGSHRDLSTEAASLLALIRYGQC